MDPLTIAGLFIGFAAILFGQHLEGGHLSSLVNGPAILIVLGGTLGAVMLQSPLGTFLRAIRITVWMFIPPVRPVAEVIEKIVGWSQVARKEGLLGLENIVDGEDD